MRGRWPERKFPGSLWSAVAIATFATISVFEILLASATEKKFEFHFESLLLIAPIAGFFFLLIAAVRRFTPLLTLPRHHADQNNDAPRKNETAS